MKKKEKERIVLSSSNKTIDKSKISKFNSLKEVEIKEGIETIESYTFENCFNLKTVILPSTLKTIKFGAFINCTSLKDIVIPDSVEIIDPYAFDGCENLKDITLSKNLKKLSSGIFRNCKSLTKIRIPYGVTKIEQFVFKGCAHLNHIFIPKSINYIDDKAFDVYKVCLIFYCLKNSYGDSFAHKNRIQVKDAKKFAYIEKSNNLDKKNEISEKEIKNIAADIQEIKNKQDFEQADDNSKGLEKNLLDKEDSQDKGNVAIAFQNKESNDKPVDKVEKELKNNIDKKSPEKLSVDHNKVKDIKENQIKKSEENTKKEIDKENINKDVLENSDKSKSFSVNTEAFDSYKEKKKKLFRIPYFVKFCLVIAIIVGAALLTSPEINYFFYPVRTVETDAGTYVGRIVDGEYFGSGTFKYKNGDEYKGYFKYSSREGNGEFFWKNGNYFSGTWESDNLAEGELTYVNGSTFKGTFSNNEFKDGEFKGKIDLGEEGYFEGIVSDSSLIGTVEFNFDNGDCFSGTIDEYGLKGEYLYNNGSTFTGTIENGNFYDGTFELNTEGINTDLLALVVDYSSGNISNVKFETIDGLSYDGEITGEATIEYPSGNSYVGDVENGYKEGRGTFKWFDGETRVAWYYGSWVNDMMQGDGIYHYTNEVYPYIEDYFENGKPDGDATYYKEENNTFNTIWKNGICIDVVES